MIAAQREGIEVAKRRGRVLEFAVGDDRDFLLGEAAMRAQGLVQPREVVLVARGADAL